MKRLSIQGKYTDKNVRELAELLYASENFDEIELDITRLHWVTIGPMIALLGVIKGWLTKGKYICISESSQRSPAYRYMQRMNFFKICHLSLQEDFNRKHPGSRFVPIETTEGEDANLSEVLSEKIARCIAPEEADLEFEFTDGWDTRTGFYDGIVYSVSELIRNVQQHSRGVGVLGAQYYPTNDVTEIAIADDGIGIAASFETSGSPHFKRIKNDVDAISVAIEPNVSSKKHRQTAYGGSENEGVGLSMLTELAIQSGGAYTIASGSGYVTNDNSWLLNNLGYPGTYISMSFKREAFANFMYLLENAKRELLGEIDINDWNIDGVFRDEQPDKD